VLTGAPLYKPPGGGKKPRLRYRAVRTLAKAHLIGEERLEAARKRHGSTDYRLAEGVMRPILVRSLHEDYSDPISRITCPVELVWGDDDTAAPLAVAQQLHAAIPGSNLVVCPGAGHLTPLSVPDQLRAAVERQRP
jgi:pimeloyl-ACP methyl ester carboxylesterase